MKIAVVIPCRNEVAYIKECIQAIYKCDLPSAYEIEVFVVDGMSDDGTREEIRTLQASYSSLHLVDNQKQLTPFAFNLGIHAAGEVDYIQIVGARHILSENYILRSVERLNSDPSVWCTGGRIINEFTTPVSAVISKAMSTSFGMGVGNFRTLSQSGYTDTVTSPMYPAFVFEKIGYFDEELIRNQDDDFNFRVIRAGGRIYYEHDIWLKYYVRGTIAGLRRQFFQYGYWKTYVNVKHKTVTTLRQLVPPFFVLYLFLLPLAFIVSPRIGMYSGVPLLCYLLINVGISWKLTTNLREFYQAFVIFWIIHISYGLGYLNGLIDFLILKQKPSEKQKRLSR